MLAIVGGDNGLVESIDQVAAIVGKGGTAVNNRYGIAYAPYGGEARGGANSVAVTEAGKASSGDGGVSRTEGYHCEASVGGHGVAILSCPGNKGFGKLRGGKDSLLVITFRDGGATYHKHAQVGTTVNGLQILENTFYTLDESTKDWKQA